MKKDADFEQLQSIFASLWIQDLTIEIVHESKIIKLTLSDNSLYMKMPILFYLFNFENCIDYMYFVMWKFASLVNEKLKPFVIVLQRNNITNAYDAIR